MLMLPLSFLSVSFTSPELSVGDKCIHSHTKQEGRLSICRMPLKVLMILILTLQLVLQFHHNQGTL